MKTSLIGRFALMLALAAGPAFGAPQLPSLFTDHMVLQRDIPIPVWGWAKAGEEISVRFAGQEKKTKADEGGTWRVKLDPVKANTNSQELVVAGETNLTVQDVLVGEVWVCSGQSNMEMPVQSCLNFPEEQKAANLPLIRHIKIPLIPSSRPQDRCGGAWQVCSPQTVGGFTAVGFFFARDIFSKLGVPVGLIGSNWGGTLIEPWIPPTGYRLVPELKAEQAQVDLWDPSTPAGRDKFTVYLDDMKTWLPRAEAAFKAGQPIPPAPLDPVPAAQSGTMTALYNGMIHPLVPFGIRGALWYQGESNGGNGMSYLPKMRALIEGWRQVWGQGSFPFYYVQLANWQKSDLNNPAGGDGWAMLREAQRHALGITNTGMAVITDIGDAADIHPKNKQDVGGRLARWALAKTYDQKDVVYSGPLYKSMAVEGDKIRLSFDSVGGGLMVGEKKGLEPALEVEDGKLQLFSIAGADKVWYAADAVIEKDTVVVSSAPVPNPVAVRYGFYMNPEGANLYNREGIPASPFRTDTW